MAFFDNEHKQKILDMEQLWSSLHELNNMASKFGINDIFQDNGAKVMQQLIYLNFQNLPGREGNDALDQNGNEWEMKSVNIATSATGFSTNHHTNHEIIEKYRHVYWSFAIYKNINLCAIYIMAPKNLEPLFQHWEEKLKNMVHLNNPKIPISFVEKNGIRIYPIDPDNPIDPCSVR